MNHARGSYRYITVFILRNRLGTVGEGIDYPIDCKYYCETFSKLTRLCSLEEGDVGQLRAPRFC